MPVRHATDTLLVTVSVNPTRRQLREVLRSVLTNPHPRYRHVIYSGLALSASGCWLLCDGPFAYEDFVAVLLATKGDQQAPLYVSTVDEASWMPSRLARDVPGLEVVLNPQGKSSSPPERFVESLSRRIGVTEGGTLLGRTEKVGTVSFDRPVLYVFPAGDGGSSLFFGSRDLSVVCDAGVGRRPAFWDFVRHFSHIDVLIGTHAGPNNIFGLETFVGQQCNGDLQMLPKLGHVIFNGSPNAMTPKQQESPTLLVHLPEEVMKITNMLHQVGIPPQVCASPAGGKTAQKINLYWKINQGSVDLYVAHPVEDSRELKEFRRQCASQAPDFVSQGAVPLTSAVSIVAALVWKPCASSDKPVRVFLPGSAPLAKVYEALDRLQGLALFESLSGSAEDQPPRPAHVAKPASSKPAAKPVGPTQRPTPQSAPTAKFTAPTKARGQQPSRSVSSPKSTREAAASRKSTSKVEPASKAGHVAKPSQSTQPTSSDTNVKRASETAVSSKTQSPLKTSQVDTELPPANVQLPPADRELPLADKVACAEVSETVDDVKAEEPEDLGLDEVAVRESVERDSLEAGVDDAMQADSLCGDDQAELHSEDEIDRDKTTSVEKASDSDYADTLHKDVDMHAEAVDVDDRIIPELADRVSPTQAVSRERADSDGELDSKHVNIVPEPDIEADVPLEDVDPLYDAAHSGEVRAAAESSYDKQFGSVEVEEDTEQREIRQQTAPEIEPEEAEDQNVGCELGGALVVDAEAACGTEIGLDEEMDTEQGEMQQEPGQELEPEEAQDQDLGYELGGKLSSDLLSDLEQFPTTQTTESVPDEPADELNDEAMMEDVKVADVEVDEPEKEVDEDRETATADSGIIPQGLPSPQKEAECFESEREDPAVATSFPVDLDQSMKYDEDAAVENSASSALLTSEDHGSEKIQQEHDHDMLMASSGHTAPDGFDLLLEGGECWPNTGTMSAESDGPTSQTPTENDTVLKSDHQAEVEQSEDNTIATEKTEEITDEAAHSDWRPEGFSEEPSPDTDEPVSVKEELGTLTQEQSASPSCDSDSHIQLSDPVPQNDDLPHPAAATDVYEEDSVPASHVEQQPIETSKDEYPVETEPPSSNFMEPCDDDLRHDADIPDIADDVPLSPVDQPAQEDIPRDREQTSFYYTEPHIQLTEDANHVSDMDFPLAETHDPADGVPDDGQKQADDFEQPRKESPGADDAEQPFDPLQSWGHPMGLPAPLNEGKDGGRKRDGGHGAKQSAQKTDAKTVASGRTGTASRDLSGGRNGRTTTKPGKPAERPTASTSSRKSAASAFDTSKVGIYLGQFGDSGLA